MRLAGAALGVLCALIGLTTARLSGPPESNTRPYPILTVINLPTSLPSPTTSPPPSPVPVPS